MSEAGQSGQQPAAIGQDRSKVLSIAADAAIVTAGNERGIQLGRLVGVLLGGEEEEALIKVENWAGRLLLLLRLLGKLRLLIIMSKGNLSGKGSFKLSRESGWIEGLFGSIHKELGLFN